ncbi:Restriction endonuclease [Bosea sp. OK403]|uniref:restriction endonuclease n=1 Tax=Bosea sp. OK403 TaxID=1855286 RepID=UPI0008EAFA14|nr:restriction endonuclease [Bosea sp. OK403]SFJ77197.1 Restriction endonuclease [Bosea sp. OK403]
MNSAWRSYQENSAKLFRSMGFLAEVEAEVPGARARHRIDVATRFTIAGVSVLWIVECKHWKSAVGKEQVMTLAQIAQDVGADRAFLLSESGFQSGAISASQHSNVTLTSLSDLSASASDHICTRQLQVLLGVKDALEKRLRDHLYDAQGRFPSVAVTDMGELTNLLAACLDTDMAIKKAMVGNLPITVSDFLSREPNSMFSATPQLITHLETLVEQVAGRADALDAQVQTGRDEAFSGADKLVAEIGELIKITDMTIPLAGDQAGRAAMLSEGLESMRRIGSISNVIERHFRQDLRRQHRSLMRLLYDGVYLVLATPHVETNAWNAVASRTASQVKAFADAVQAARHST